MPKAPLYMGRSAYTIRSAWILVVLRTINFFEGEEAWMMKYRARIACAATDPPSLVQLANSLLKKTVVSARQGANGRKSAGPIEQMVVSPTAIEPCSDVDRRVHGRVHGLTAEPWEGISNAVSCRRVFQQAADRQWWPLKKRSG